MTPKEEKHDGQPQWRPIETAPKDGTVLLGYDNGFGREIVWWSVPMNEWYSDGEPLEFWTPTHWMPLPDAPTDDDIDLAVIE
jgi:hypothetical protein